MVYKKNSDKRLIQFLLFSACIISICGLSYELIIASLSVSLKGNYILQYSIAIGFFMSAMGIGSFLARFIKSNLIYKFIIIESILGFIGGISVSLLNLVYINMINAYQIISIIFLLIIGTLVGIEIPLVTFIIKKFSNVKETISNVLTFDYIGGLIASLVFPLLLYPYLGLTKTSFIIGFINVFIAMIAFIFFSKLDKKKRILFIIINLISSIVLITGFLFSSVLTGYYSNKIFGHVLYDEKSIYQRILFANKNGNIRLFLDNYLQFSSKHEHRYHESLIIPAFYCNPEIENVLILGAGDGLAVREILKFQNVKKIVLVELDKKVTDIAKNLAVFRKLNKNSLENKKTKIINQDAYIFLKENNKKFDVIYADFPDPHSPELAKLYSYEFFTLIFNSLIKNGIFITQSSSPYYAKKVFWSIHRTLNKVFTTVIPYHINVPDFGEWGFIMAMKNSLMWPYKIKDNNRKNFKFFSHKIFQSSLVFPNDMKENSDLDINYILEPKLFTYYLQSWNK